MDPLFLDTLLSQISSAISSDASVAWIQALVAGAVGAWAGSWATQRTINRHQDLNAARAELRAVNHAINLSFTVANHYLGYKRQMTLPMLEAFKAVESDVRASISAGAKEISFQLDFLILPIVDLPVSHLQDIMLEKLPIGGRGLVAAMQLRGAHQNLEDSLRERRQLIETFRSSGAKGRRLTEFYLGLADADGNVDHRFHDNVLAIAQLVDDCIFFSTVVAKDLYRHGGDLLSRHGRRLGTKRKHLTQWNWDERANTLMPKDDNYQDWLKGFPEPRVWWKFWADGEVTGK